MTGLPHSQPGTGDPMDDLIYRLRSPAWSWSEAFGSNLDKEETINDMVEAADEIVALQQSCEELGDKVKARDAQLFVAEREVAALRSRVEELTKALQFIADGYDNCEVNHVDYRVKAYQVATGALAMPLDKSGGAT